MRVMNEVLKDFIRKIVIVCLDDILIYWQSKEEHMKHVRTLLEKLQKDKLWINLQKCSFMKTKLFFWGFVIPKDGLKMDPGKFKAIIDWPSPKSTIEERSFHGVASLYRKFIRNFSRICGPIVETFNKTNHPFH